MLQDRLLSGADLTAERARHEERRERQRQFVAATVHAATGWLTTMETLAIASASNRWRKSDWTEWVDTDSGREMTRNRQLIVENSRKLRLATSEPQLIEILNAADELLADPSPLDPRWSDSGTSDDERTAAYRHFGQLKRLYLTLEQRAISLLAD